MLETLRKLQLQGIQLLLRQSQLRLRGLKLFCSFPRRKELIFAKPELSAQAAKRETFKQQLRPQMIKWATLTKAWNSSKPHMRKSSLPRQK